MNKLYEQVGESVRNARRAKKISQMQLDERSQINQADISRIETGRRNITLGTLWRLAHGLECTVFVRFVDTKGNANVPV